MWAIGEEVFPRRTKTRGKKFRGNDPSKLEQNHYIVLVNLSLGYDGVEARSASHPQRKYANLVTQKSVIRPTHALCVMYKKQMFYKTNEVKFC
jgi:hypothetical protein